MNKLEEFSEVNYLKLTVNPDNIPAQKLYESEGFKATTQDQVSKMINVITYIKKK